MQVAKLASTLVKLVTTLLAIGVAHVAVAESPSTDVPATKALTSSEVDRYIATLDGLLSAGLDAEREMGGPGDMKSMKQSATYSQKMLGIIEDHGFDSQSFTSVHWNVMMAWAANEMAKRQPEIDAARRQQAAQLEQMKAQLSPEQYQAVVQGMAGMNAFTDAYANVPEANKKLVAGYAAQLDAIFERAK